MRELKLFSLPAVVFPKRVFCSRGFNEVNDDRKELYLDLDFFTKHEKRGCVEKSFSCLVLSVTLSLCRAEGRREQVG